MKPRVFVILMIFLMSSAACHDTSGRNETVGPDFGMSSADITTFEDLCKWSNTIVKARYIGKEEFSHNTTIFKFEVETDFIGTAENEKILNVYESAMSSFIKGKSYYLFLTGSRSAGYPHIVYGRLAKGFLLGEQIKNGNREYTFYNDYKFDVQAVTDFSEYIQKEIIEKGSFIADAPELFSESLESACENADVILLVTVTGTEPVNKYVSTCFYEVDRFLKEKYLMGNGDEKFSFEDMNEKEKEILLEAAGSYIPNTLASAATKAGDQLILLLKYNSNHDLVMYSGQHGQYPVDSEAGKTILELCK